MDYDQMTVGSGSALKRFSHGRRFRVAVELLDVGPADTVLDYGAGDGHLLSLLDRTRLHHSAFVAFEPVKEMAGQLSVKVSGSGIRVIRTLLDVEGWPFQRVACCEVLEHLDPWRQRTALDNIRKALAPDGFAVVSVPIEVGIASILKNAARLAIGQAHPGTTPANLFRSFFGIPVCRQDDGWGYIPSHIGFYYQDLEKLFAPAGLRIVRRRFSPFPWLHRFINSQVFYVLRREG